MPKNLSHLMRQTSAPAPRERLLDDVMTTIAARRRRQAMVRVPLLFAGLAASAVGSFVATWMTITQGAQNGLWQFLGAAVTDTGAVLASWQPYLLTLLETVPVAPLAAACATLCAFLALLRRVDRDFTPHSHHLTHAYYGK